MLNLDVVLHQPLAQNGGGVNFGIVLLYGTGSKERLAERQLLGQPADQTGMSIEQKQMERHCFTRVCFKTPL
jgi:hypothetical protein